MVKKAASSGQGPTWLGPQFSSEVQRNAAVRSVIDETLASAITEKREGHSRLPDTFHGLVTELAAPIHGASPQAAASAELAFVLSAFCIAEERVLHLTQPSADLGRNRRVAGDRTVSEHLARQLAHYNIPTTQGALQSSTFRNGYDADQARETTLREFLGWVADGTRDVDDLKLFIRALAREFAEAEQAFRPLPGLVADAFTFATTRRLIDALLASPSGGAYQQYLVAVLTEAEYALIDLAWRVETKGIGASDRSARSAGDVQVRQRQALVHSIEVSDSAWGSKVGQAATTARQTSLQQVTVVAPAPGLTGDALAATVASDEVPPNVDIAVVDLRGYLDTVSSRLTSVARAGAIRRLYGHLKRWGRTRPDLVDHLVSAIETLGLASGEDHVETGVDAMESLERLRAQANVGDGPWIEIARDDLGRVLSLVDGTHRDTSS